MHVDVVGAHSRSVWNIRQTVVQPVKRTLALPAQRLLGIVMIITQLLLHSDLVAIEDKVPNRPFVNL